MQLSENVSLRSLHTFHIGVSCRWLAHCERIADISEALAFARSKSVNHLVLGGGSNVLFTEDIDSLVIRNELKGIEKTGEDDDYYYVRAAAGEDWHGFVLHCIRNGYAGLENLSLIPGCVGASPMQNIGAYGVEVRDVFHSLNALDISTGEAVSFSKEDCHFGYRESVFKNKYKGRFIITDVTFRLRKEPEFHLGYGDVKKEVEASGEPLSIRAVSDAVIRIRQSKLPDPAKLGNAGSFFKNPVVDGVTGTKLRAVYPQLPAYPAAEGAVKLAAGWLIEQCGWKGFREGDAGVHERQALVLVNYGNAAGSEVLALSQRIIDSVHDRFGVMLEREVNIC